MSISILNYLVTYRQSFKTYVLQKVVLVNIFVCGKVRDCAALYHLKSWLERFLSILENIKHSGPQLTQCCSFSETVKMIRNGWNFNTEEDCIDFVSNNGRISSYKTCSERHLSSGCDDERSQEACCPPVWDGFLCWPPAPVNSVVEQLCPGNLPQLNHKSMQHASETSMHFILKISKLKFIMFTFYKQFNFFFL